MSAFHPEQTSAAPAFRPGGQLLLSAVKPMPETDPLLTLTSGMAKQHLCAERRTSMTRNDWVQFLSYYTWFGVLLIVAGLVVVVVTLVAEKRRTGRQRDDRN